MPHTNLGSGLTGAGIFLFCSHFWTTTNNIPIIIKVVRRIRNSLIILFFIIIGYN
jgi:hypothetical protein